MKTDINIKNITRQAVNAGGEGISRRSFLKRIGAGSAAVAVASLPGCATTGNQSQDGQSGEMTYRINPRGDQKISILGYGCMRWPTLQNPAEDGNVVDQQKVNELVDYAIEHGVNYFDTAPVYIQGWSEVATGNALSRHPREKYHVATKLSFLSEPTFENSIAMYHSSMEKLKVDYIDYYLLHSVGGGRDPFQSFSDRFENNGVLDYLLKEREEGRIRNLGFSFHGDVRLFDYLMERHDSIHWDFVQIQMNYVDWKNAGGRNVNAEYLFGELKKRNIPVVVMEPLLGGRLSKLPQHLVSRLLQRDPEHSAASWAFRFVGSYPEVLTVLSGMTYMEHLEENVETYSPLRSLSEEDKQFLWETAVLMLKYPTIPCNDCKYCMPCPYGLDIPAILIHYNKCVNEGRIAQNSGDDNYRRARREFLIGYDRAVPKMRQADHCTGCRECVAECPQGIDIPEQMKRIDRYVEGLKQGNVPLTELRDQLHEGRKSLVLCSGGSLTRSFSSDGVKDLYGLLKNEPLSLSGASLADKVVGRGAAILMILGGVREVYADLISTPAIKLFKEHDIRVVYREKTDEILNRSKSDICPVEKICKANDDFNVCVEEIGKFLQTLDK